LGTNTLVCSYVAPCCVTAAGHNEIVLDFQSMSASLPAWWGFRPGLCRPSSLAQSPDFTTGPFTCFDYWGGLAIAGSLSDPPVGNRWRYRALVAVVVGTERPIPEGTETYADKIIINNARTTGLGSCPGCGIGVCIVLNSIKILQPPGTPGGNKFISAPAVRNWATWQGGIGTDCFAATPARNSTWGSVKTLYR